MSGEVVSRPSQRPDEPRRRFGRRTTDPPGAAAAEEDAESFAAVRAELLLLREENARLKAAQHQHPDVSRLIGRARALATADLDRDSVSDDVEHLLVEGLLIRESLLEICREVERSMVAFEGKLNALALTLTVERTTADDADETTNLEQPDGYGTGAG
jgi:hypothetical protein